MNTPVRSDLEGSDNPNRDGIGRAGECDTCGGHPKDIQVPNRFDPDYYDDVPGICPECGRSSA